MNTRRPTYRNLLILLMSISQCIFVSYPARAQGKTHTVTAAQPLIMGQKITLYSRLLSEKRELLVHLPKGYEQSRQNYPILIVLDGNEQFAHAVTTVDFLSDYNRMPKMIVVGVPNMQRRIRDLSAPLLHDTALAKSTPKAGGADKFIMFMSNELLPALHRRYRVAPYHVLFGHSLGGLVNMMTLLSHPTVFQAHIAASPSLWWDNDTYLERTKAQLGQLTAPNFLFFSWSARENRVKVSSEILNAWLIANPPKGVTWASRVYEDETHGTTPYRTLYDGLSKLYEGWAFEPKLGDDADYPAQLALHQAKRSIRYGYPAQPEPKEIDDLAAWYIGKGRYAEALPIAKSNFERFPNNGDLAVRVAEVLDHLKMPTEAVCYYRRAVASPGPYADHWAMNEKISQLSSGRSGRLDCH